MSTTPENGRLLADVARLLVTTRRDLHESARKRKDRAAEENASKRKIQAIRDLLDTRTVINPERTLDGIRKLAGPLAEDKDPEPAKGETRPADGGDPLGQCEEGVKPKRGAKNAQIELNPRTKEGQHLNKEELVGEGSKTAHEHEYVPEHRSGWDGVNCRICGFHVPKSKVHLSAVQERLVSTRDTKEELVREGEAERLAMSSERSEKIRKHFTRELRRVASGLKRRRTHGSFLDRTGRWRTRSPARA